MLANHYLSSSNNLVLTQIDVTVQKGKYRGSDKLSNAGIVNRKSKETKLDEIYI